MDRRQFLTAAAATPILLALPEAKAEAITPAQDEMSEQFVHGGGKVVRIRTWGEDHIVHRPDLCGILAPKYAAAVVNTKTRTIEVRIKFDGTILLTGGDTPQGYGLFDVQGKPKFEVSYVATRQNGYGRVAYSTVDGTTIAVASPPEFLPTDAIIPDYTGMVVAHAPHFAPFHVRAAECTNTFPAYDPDRRDECHGRGFNLYRLPDGTEVYIGKGGADQPLAKFISTDLAPRVGGNGELILVVLSGGYVYLEHTATPEKSNVFGLFRYRG